jgi:hypothetical protein
MLRNHVALSPKFWSLSLFPLPASHMKNNNTPTPGSFLISMLLASNIYL